MMTRSLVAFALVAAAGVAEAAPGKPLAPDCLPDFNKRGMHDERISHVRFARAGGQLAVCGWDGDVLRACWNIDGKTAALSKRDVAPLPGVGFTVSGCWKGLCAKPRTKEDKHVFVLHPDGARAASVTGGGEIAVFDVATKKITSSFTAKLEAPPTDAWFVGDTIFTGALLDHATRTLRVDAFKLDGSSAGTYTLKHGGAAVSDDKLVLHDMAATKVIVLDGKKPPSTIGPRAIPKAPCKLPEQDWDRLEGGMSGDPKIDAQANTCLQHLQTHYEPYEAAKLVVDGTRLIGLGDKASTLVVLDARTLAPGKPLFLKMCDLETGK